MDQDGATVEISDWTVGVTAGTEMGAVLSAELQPDLPGSPLDGVEVSGPLVDVNLSSGQPTAGAIVRHTLTAPVPREMVALLAYLDEASDEWIPVFTSLSSDRRVVQAETNHFSTWGVWQYVVADLIGKRAPAPSCGGVLPNWVGSVDYFIDINAPVSYCAELDPSSPAVLEIDLSINRGYGMWLSTATEPLWSWSSGADPYAWGDWSQEVSGLLAGTVYIGPGEEVHLGFAEEEVRGQGSRPLVRVVGDPRSLLASLLIEQIADAAGDASPALAQATGLVAAVSCGTQLVTGGVPGAAVQCLLTKSDEIYRTAVQRALLADPTLTPRAAADGKRLLLRGLRWAAAGLVGVDLQEMVIDYGPFTDGMVGDNVLIGSLTVFPRSAPPARSDVGTTSGENVLRFDGVGELSLSMVAADLVQLGYVDQGNLYEGPGAPCVSYQDPAGGPWASVESATGRVLGFSDGLGQGFRTEIGDIAAGSTLDYVLDVFSGPSYEIEQFFNGDFGQGADGIVITTAGGSIGLALDGFGSDAVVVYVVGVGVPDHAPNVMESGC